MRTKKLNKKMDQKNSMTEWVGDVLVHDVRVDDVVVVCVCVGVVGGDVYRKITL